MNCMFLLDDDCNRVWTTLYCFENSRQQCIICSSTAVLYYYSVVSFVCSDKREACHYLTNRFQIKTPRAPREAFKKAPRSLRGYG